MVDPHTQKNGRHKKRRTVIYLLKVALFMIRRRSVKQKTPVAEQGSGSLWRTLVASVRPLHLQSNDSPPPTLESNLSENRNGASSSSSAFDSPVYGWGYKSQSPSREPESRYSSALDLIELVDQNEEEEISTNDDEDVTIDAKAEEFIAQFYEEMRRQRLHYC